MFSKQTIVTLMFVLATGCVTERPAGDDDGNGSGSGSAIDPNWVASPYVDSLAADDSYVYFASDRSQTESVLARVSVNGGTPEVLYTAPPADTTVFTAFSRVTAIYLGPNDIAFVVSVGDLASGAQERTLMTVPKAGGTVKELSTSNDSRSFLGATIEGSNVYFSSFTALLRVPLAGGAVQFVGESPNSVQYWAFSPTVIAGQLYWAENHEIYRVATTATGDDGTMFASTDYGMTILGTTPTSFVVGVSTQPGLYNPANQFAEIDLATGTMSALHPLGGELVNAAVAGDDVFAATYQGLIRAPRSGAAPTTLTTDQSNAVAVTAGALFVGTPTGITRIAH
jgi:hypothetical protein